MGEAAAYCMKYRDVEKLLTAHGFELIRQQGSHRHFQGFVDGKRCIVTLA
ncbi:MAG: type II toxin-antitoxin system HicA family toxin [Geminicoccaceae bacterium]